MDNVAAKANEVYLNVGKSRAVERWPTGSGAVEMFKALRSLLIFQVESLSRE